MTSWSVFGTCSEVRATLRRVLVRINCRGLMEEFKLLPVEGGSPSTTNGGGEVINR